jgi:hypothetical protein
MADASARPLRDATGERLADASPLDDVDSRAERLLVVKADTSARAALATALRVSVGRVDPAGASVCVGALDKDGPLEPLTAAGADGSCESELVALSTTMDASGLRDAVAQEEIRGEGLALGVPATSVGDGLVEATTDAVPEADALLALESVGAAESREDFDGTLEAATETSAETDGDADRLTEAEEVGLPRALLETDGVVVVLNELPADLVGRELAEELVERNDDTEELRVAVDDADAGGERDEVPVALGLALPPRVAIVLAVAHEDDDIVPPLSIAALGDAEELADDAFDDVDNAEIEAVPVNDDGADADARIDKDTVAVFELSAEIVERTELEDEALSDEEGEEIGLTEIVLDKDATVLVDCVGGRDADSIELPDVVAELEVIALELIDVSDVGLDQKLVPDALAELSDEAVAPSLALPLIDDRVDGVVETIGVSVPEAVALADSVTNPDAVDEVHALADSVTDTDAVGEVHALAVIVADTVDDGVEIVLTVLAADNDPEAVDEEVNETTDAELDAVSEGLFVSNEGDARGLVDDVNVNTDDADAAELLDDENVAKDAEAEEDTEELPEPNEDDAEALGETLAELDAETVADADFVESGEFDGESVLTTEFVE